MDAQVLSNCMRKKDVAPAIQEILHAPIALQIINIAQNVIGMQMNISPCRNDGAIYRKNPKRR